MNNDVVFDIKHCDKCDLAIGCRFIPSKGRGQGNSVLYLLPTPTASDHKQGISRGRKHRIIHELNDYYNLNAYFTYLVKCIGKSVLFEHEINNCSTHLKKELFIVQPKIIVTIGDVVTKQFLNYRTFKKVVDKPHIVYINNKEVIIYPIYHVNYKDKQDMLDLYKTSFINISKLYKGFVDSNYFNTDIL